jgi:hypothetical protein
LQGQKIYFDPYAGGQTSQARSRSMGAIKVPVMDDAIAGGSTMVHADLRDENPARNLAEEDIRQAVIAAYTGALKGSEEMRRGAFNAALRAYRMRKPGISEGIARRRVAQIICFADWYGPY